MGLDLIELLRSGPYGRLALLIEYGSNASGSDRDFWAVFESQPRTSAILLGGLDLWAVSEAEAAHLIGLLDPFVTEPLLTGTVIFDEAGVADRLRESLSATRSDAQTARYLLHRSYQAYIEAYGASQVPDHGNPRSYWSNLLFSVSYRNYARIYLTEGHKAITLDDSIASMPAPLRSIWDEMVDHKHENSEIDASYLDAITTVVLTSQ